MTRCFGSPTWTTLRNAAETTPYISPRRHPAKQALQPLRQSNQDFRAPKTVVNLFYEDTAEHDDCVAVARRFENIRANVGEYPPIIAAGIQRISRDERNPGRNEPRH